MPEHFVRTRCDRWSVVVEEQACKSKTSLVAFEIMQNIAEAVNKHGGHYQGAITYTTHEDPTLYNVKWVAQMAKALRDLGAHSLAIKDMSGIASPAMMKVLRVRSSASFFCVCVCVRSRVRLSLAM